MCAVSKNNWTFSCNARRKQPLSLGVLVYREVAVALVTTRQTPEKKLCRKRVKLRETQV